LVWELVDTVQAHLVETLAPDGFNIGVNVRPAQERLARG
jgi:diadenosine tetraphosphate (Ap4A) HIT family hydrolase